MNKLLQIILLSILSIYVLSQTVCGDAMSTINEDTCRILPTNIDYTHCCYVELNGAGQCRQLNDDQYENIKRYKEYLENTNDNVKIKCSGEFLTYSLFALLALLF